MLEQQKALNRRPTSHITFSKCSLAVVMSINDFLSRKYKVQRFLNRAARHQILVSVQHAIRFWPQCGPPNNLSLRPLTLEEASLGHLALSCLDCVTFLYQITL